MDELLWLDTSLKNSVHNSRLPYNRNLWLSHLARAAQHICNPCQTERVQECPHPGLLRIRTRRRILKTDLHHLLLDTLP